METVRAVALAAAIGAVVATQADAQGPIIGFRLGASLAKADVETVIFEDLVFDPATLTRFTGGGFIRFGFRGFGIQPELMYVTKGVAVEEEIVAEGESINVEGNLHMDYVEVPLLLHLQFGTGSISPYLVAGPAFAFELSCTAELTASSSAGEETFSEDCDDEGRKKFDVGAMVGGGLTFPAGPGSLVIDGRYNYGLINLVEDEAEGSFKQRAFSITAGFQIPLGVR